MNQDRRFYPRITQFLLYLPHTIEAAWTIITADDKFIAAVKVYFRQINPHFK